MIANIKVGIADMAVSKTPAKILTIGLGSCLGVSLYDSESGVGGLVHVMLPDSTKITNNSNKCKFVDTGLMELHSKVIRTGATKENLVAKIAGGAQMFNFANKDMCIGDKNIAAVTKILGELRIPIVASDVGGKSGRTVELDLSTGELMIKTLGVGVKII